MAKKKKKKGQKNSLYKSLKPFIKNNQVLLSVIGAAAGGVALAALIGSDKGKQVIDSLSDSVKDLMNMEKNGRVARTGTTSAKKPSSAPAT